MYPKPHGYILSLAEATIEKHQVAPHDEWTKARKDLLAKEKEFTRLRDQLSHQRRELPLERVEKNYVFDAPAGEVTLAELFARRTQLLVYRFIFDPAWDAGDARGNIFHTYSTCERGLDMLNATYHLRRSAAERT